MPALTFTLLLFFVLVILFFFVLPVLLLVLVCEIARGVGLVKSSAYQMSKVIGAAELKLTLLVLLLLLFGVLVFFLLFLLLGVLLGFGRLFVLGVAKILEFVALFAIVDPLVALVGGDVREVRRKIDDEHVVVSCGAGVGGDRG